MGGGLDARARGGEPRGMVTRTLTLPPTPVAREDGERLVAVRVVASPDRGLIDAVIPVDRAVTVGRRPEVADLCVRDARMSGTHLRLLTLGGRDLAFEDPGSKNGTFVNGLPARGGPLADGDVIRAGDTCLVCTVAAGRPGVEDLGAALVGDAPSFRDAVDRVLHGARSELAVLILGETGAGKEVMARLAHRASGRTGAFVPINCSAIPMELAESAFFGHQKGAYTGATVSGRGYFREADGGTLFLDEVGELPPSLQPRLLRALEEKLVVPVGGTRPIAADVRVLAATNVDLEARVASGDFRADLYSRLRAWTVRLPALRARREDILRLARFFAGLDPAVPPAEPPWEADLAEALLIHPWPFNVRELAQVVKGLAIRGGEPPFALGDLAPELRDQLHAARVGEAPAPPGGSAGAGERDEDTASATPTREELLGRLEASDYNISAVARCFGRDRRQVYRWMDRLGIDRPEPPA